MKRSGSQQPGPSNERRWRPQNEKPRERAAGNTGPAQEQLSKPSPTLDQNVVTNSAAPGAPEKVRFSPIVPTESSSASMVNLQDILTPLTPHVVPIPTASDDQDKERKRRDSNSSDLYNYVRRGSLSTEPAIEPPRRVNNESPPRDILRRGSYRRGSLDLDAYFRRRESIDGGALKQLMDYLKTKAINVTDDVSEIMSAISLGRSSVSTVISLQGLETNPNDPHSFSRCDLVYVERLEIHWYVQFEKQTLDGDLTLDVRRRKTGVTTLSLDTHNLGIISVRVNGLPTGYILFPHKTEFGSRMDIYLPDNKSESYNVYIKYKTDPSAAGLQWLKSDSDGHRPFVFSQCDSIQCRSLLPIQDTPSNKVKYTARITAPSGMKVLMSAPREKHMVMHSDGHSTHYFRQEVPVPPYLIAFAVGHLAWARVCERTTVWALPQLVDKMKRELACTEDLLSIAETICGEYIWGKYDVLVLPPSEFNLSAMENPSLTFINPSLVSGDGCIPTYIAHEIAHSWVGNMVTHSNYEHLWLSEGFANFIGRKILGKRYGNEARLFAASRGFKDLQMVIDIYGRNHPLTSLVADLSNRKPREAVLIVPYEKGHTLLYYLELLAGDPYQMDQYIKEYIATFKGQSINSSLFRTHFTEFFSKSQILKDIDWNAWLNAPGMPPFRPDYHTSLEDACTALKDMWLNWKWGERCPFTETDLNILSIMQILEFLSQMLECPPLPQFKLEAMDKLYHFETLDNPDAHLKWYLLCLRGHWKSKVDPALNFAREDGRQFCVLAVFHELTQWEEMREEAMTAFFRMKSAVSMGTMRVLAALLRVDPTEEPQVRKRKTPVPDKRSDDAATNSTRRRDSVVGEDLPELTIRRKNVTGIRSRLHPNSKASTHDDDKRPP